MTDVSTGPQTRTVFISHRHEDREIADVLREFVEDLPIANARVHQSTFPENGPRVGRSLTRELREQLYAANVVFCVFTRQDEDWSYCMWECGVATDPLCDKTRVVIFQFGTDCPSPYQDQVRVEVRDRNSVRSFVHGLLTDPDFFPGFDEAVAAQWRSEKIIKKADDLYDSLQEKIHEYEADVDEWPAWAFLRIQLGLRDVEKWKTETDREARFAAARESLLTDAQIVDGDKTARNLFARAKFPAGMRFSELVDDWQTKHSLSSPEWVDSLARQVMRAGMWKFPEPEWVAMRDTSSNNTDWCIPVLNWVRRIPRTETIQFDVYFIPLMRGRDGAPVIRFESNDDELVDA